MNFVDLEFWLILFSSGMLVLVLRSVFLRIRPQAIARYDAAALAATSLVLFFAASGTSFSIFLLEVVLTYVVLRLILKLPRGAQWPLASVVIALQLLVLFY